MARPEVARKRVRLDSEERRALILVAARKLLSSRPYSEVSMADLADEAGVARGLLHHYFGSKRELYLAVIRDVVRLPTLAVPDDAAEGTVEEVWEASVDGWMRLVEANRDTWIDALSAGGVGRDPEVEAMLDEGKEVVADRALQALGLHHDPPPEVRAIVRGYGGLTEEIAREWLQRGRLNRAQARTVLVSALPLLIDQLVAVVLAQRDDAPAPVPSGRRRRGAGAEGAGSPR